MIKNHRLAPIIFLVISIPIAVLMAFFLLAGIFTHDVKLPNDSDLLLSKVSVADADNAYVVMQKIETAKTFSSDLNSRLTEAVVDFSSHEAFAKEMIDYHSADISLFRQAAAKPSFQDPTFADPTTFDLETGILTDYSSYRQVAQVVALQAEQLVKQGNISGGLDEAIEIVKFGHLMENSQGVIISYLVGSSIKQTGLTAIRQIALNSKLSSTQANDIAVKLEAYRDSRQGEAMAMKTEYLAYKDYLTEFNNRLGPLLGSLYLSQDATTGETVQHNSRLGNILDYSGLSSFYYHPNQTLGYKIEIMRPAVQNAIADCSTVEKNLPLKFPMKNPTIAWFFTPNAIGKYLISIGEISMGALSTKRCNESVAISATQITLGVSAFNNENGHLPANLSELAPKYLEGIPLDPYNNQPLVYDFSRKLIYSVGSDRRDVGGSEVSNDWQNLGNPSFILSR